jgi:hypothetical protein
MTPIDGTEDKEPSGMDELTQKLTSGTHPVTVGGPQPSLEDFRRRVEELGYAFIKFTGTRGGTDLGVRLDRAACSIDAAAFDEAGGSVHLEGTLILNDDPVRCIADIDTSTLDGAGHLTSVTEAELID